MYTKQALRELGVSPGTLTEAQKKQFDEQGYFIVENVLSRQDCETMRNAFERIHAAESEKGGHEVHVEPGPDGSRTSSTRPTPSTSASGFRRSSRLPPTL